MSLPLRNIYLNSCFAAIKKVEASSASLSDVIEVFAELNQIFSATGSQSELLESALYQNEIARNST